MGEYDECVTQNSAFPLLSRLHLLNRLNNGYYHGRHPQCSEISSHWEDEKLYALVSTSTHFELAFFCSKLVRAISKEVIVNLKSITAQSVVALSLVSVCSMSQAGFLDNLFSSSTKRTRCSFYDNSGDHEKSSRLGD